MNRKGANMTKEEAIEIINRENDPNDTKVWEVFPEYREALDMAIQALEQMLEVTSTMQTGQFDYVPIRETKGISCTECKYFKITQEPLRGMGGLIDLGQARCEKHDLIKDFSHKGQFKYLKPCEYYEDFKD